MAMDMIHSSNKRPESLKPADYDHEIALVDHTRTPPKADTPDSQAPTERISSSPDSPAASRQDSTAPLNPKHPLRGKIMRRKYVKYQNRQLEEHTGSDVTDDEQPLEAEPDAEATDGDGEERCRPRTAGSRTDKKPDKKAEEPESVIDILFENQRGLMLCCCMPLFSSKALGNLDPSPWTNSAQKTSITDTTTAQCPDPSWEWVWKDWSINKTPEVDDNGWEYSFMFSNKFAWHSMPSWWNSYVRRRAWIRKRGKKHIPLEVNEAHMLNEDYFTIHPAVRRSKSCASTNRASTMNRWSVSQLANQKMDDKSELEDISDIPSLMRHLKRARIDREKMEVVQNFVEHGGDELYYLQERMHEIMEIFVFQASRRLLLAHIIQTFAKATDANKKLIKQGVETTAEAQRRLDNLESAIKHADEDVQRLEFWSDVKDMAEKGQTQGAVDITQGWDETWASLDNSAPKDVLSQEKLPGKADCLSDEEGNRTAIELLPSKIRAHNGSTNDLPDIFSSKKKGKEKADSSPSRSMKGKEKESGNRT